MRVLIVEDEQEITDFLKSNFERHCFAVDTSHDGESGSFLARTNDYDLIILDNVMPKMHGKEVCQEVRKKKADVPIIIVSVDSTVPTKVELLDIGADDYLTKPFAFDELLARARAILRRPKQVSRDAMRIGDFFIDQHKQTVFKNNTPINLTRKEFMLFQLLVKMRGDIVTRSTILEHAWDINADPFSNTIEAHIRSLRNKLGLESRDSLIKTISGRGYRID